MKVFKNLFNLIISPENLFLAWDKFKNNKNKKRDVMEFERQLEKNIFQLHRDLKYHKYKHGAYTSFYINDPKQRLIHKASVRDRVLHHAIFTIINSVFEPTFISNSFSCRINKGTHKGVDLLNNLLRQESRNNFKQSFVLKCDIKKFFETIDHFILIDIICKKIKDENAIWLLKEIIESFSSKHSTIFSQKGLPLGNLTSQLFANIYLNEFDQFIKQELKIKHYIRYTDDFVIISQNKPYLENLIKSVHSFLKEKLLLELHPQKIEIRKFQQGVDFLGYIALPSYRLLRAKTKKRIFKKLKNKVEEYKKGLISEQSLKQSLQSYLGVFSHANTYNLTNELKNQFWFWLSN